jgi:hypothetical protein
VCGGSGPIGVAKGVVESSESLEEPSSRGGTLWTALGVCGDESDVLGSLGTAGATWECEGAVGVLESSEMRLKRVESCSSSPPSSKGCGKSESDGGDGMGSGECNNAKEGM